MARGLPDGARRLAGAGPPQEGRRRAGSELPLTFWDNHNPTPPPEKNPPPTTHTHKNTHTHWRYKNTAAPAWQADRDRKCPAEAETGEGVRGGTLGVLLLLVSAVSF